MSKVITKDLADWVDLAKSDASLHLQRTAIDIVLSALAGSAWLSQEVHLKGGIWMSLLFNSPRYTSDVDLSISRGPNKHEADKVASELNRELLRAAISRGRPDLHLRVQAVELKPRKNNFESANTPALVLSIGYAVKGTTQFKHLNKGKSSQVIRLDVSYNEPIASSFVVGFDKKGSQFLAYSLTDFVAEKLRALLQQPIRNRERRQDAYDLWLLGRNGHLAEIDRSLILDTLRLKCQGRGVELHPRAMHNPEVATRAEKEWQSLEIEVEDLPPFDECFAVVLSLYDSLPWTESES